MQNASRDPLVGEAALGALEGITRLRIARGKKIIDVQLAMDQPTDEELLSLLLGRSGKLRAPAIKVGTEMFVGYNYELLSLALL